VNWTLAVLHPVYLLIGSALMGFVACVTMLGLARWLGKREDRQFVLLIALVVLTVGVARALNLSVMVALVVLGMLARNLDRRHVLMPLRAGYGGQLFFVILFVLTGTSLEFGALATASLAVAGFIVARFVGKAVAIYAFSRATGLRRRGAGLLSVALLPMSGLAVVMLHDAQSLVPGLRQELAAVVLASIAILELAGPIATQFALRRAGETRPEPQDA
jgi:Kef-type K+ transport system membrane component KefB